MSSEFAQESAIMSETNADLLAYSVYTAAKPNRKMNDEIINRIFVSQCNFPVIFTIQKGLKDDLISK